MTRTKADYEELRCAMCGGDRIKIMFYVYVKTGKVDWSETCFALASGNEEPHEHGMCAAYCDDCAEPCSITDENPRGTDLEEEVREENRVHQREAARQAWLTSRTDTELKAHAETLLRSNEVPILPRQRLALIGWILSRSD